MTARRTEPPIKTDLGIIRVESRGLRDTVYLTHNNLKAFALNCFDTGPSELQISDHFRQCSNSQWREVLMVYLNWKRISFPGFRLEPGTGRKKDGSTHPWRTQITNKPISQKPITTD